MKALVITVVAILLGLAASLANIVWLAALATLVALAGAYAQYRDTLPFEFVFSLAGWQENGNEFNLVIPQKQHSKSKPTATVFRGKPRTMLRLKWT